MRLLKIGHDQSCDIVLYSSRVSALHAEITLLDNGDILLEDKHSTNGTFVMNRPIKPGVLVNIKRGDAIRFADVELIWDQIPPLEDLSQYKAVYGIGTNSMNGIQLVGKTVSRFHATLKIDKKGRATLQDHSKNGTLVNGLRITKGQDVPIKRNDSVVCGGVPVDLRNYIPSASNYRMLAIVASVLVLLCAGYGVWRWLDHQAVSPKDSVAMENGTACIYGAYYYVVTLKDDPFKGEISDWPSEWIFGQDGKGNLVNLNFSHYCKTVKPFRGTIQPFYYTGTAFFISKNGEMGTNRHIAVPWEYTKQPFENDIRNFMTVICQSLSPEIALQTSMTDVELVGKVSRIANTEMEISGKFEYFGVGLSGSKVNNITDIQNCQVIKESGDPQKDVALIRLNSRKTPDYLVKMGAIYDIEKARIDERSLKVQEKLTVIGYPAETVVGKESFNGQELHPSMHQATLSKIPDDNQMQIQTVGIGGQSGSPVIDEKHRLVGVLCSGFGGTEITYCCNIKHLKDLYERNKVRE